MEEKIAFLLEKICLVHKNLLWKIASDEKLTPTQIEIIFLIASTRPEKALTSIIAKELGLTKPTISESVKSLKSKGVVTTMALGDKRKHAILLTPKGKKIFQKLSKLTQTTKRFFKSVSSEKQELLFEVLFDFIQYLRDKGLLTRLRVCPFCGNLHYNKQLKEYFCYLSLKPITYKTMQTNCPEYEEPLA